MEGEKRNSDLESSIKSNESSYRVRIPSECSSDLETSVRTTTSYISQGSNNDYDALESIVDVLKLEGANTPLKLPPKLSSPSRQSLKTASASPKALESVKEEKTDAFGYHIIDIEKLKSDEIQRSQSLEMFDDPKYNKLMPIINGESGVPSALQLYKPPKFRKAVPNDTNGHRSLSMKRSASANAEGAPFDKQENKDYMSLQQLLEIVNTKLTPSRETSVEIEETDEELYCPRVVRPVPIDIY